MQEQSQNVVAFRVESMLQDLRFAVRQLRKNPGFAGTAILVLALGMAASVAIFAFVDAALLQPLPYQNPSRLVVAYETTNSCRECNLSYPDYLDWKKTNTSFSSFEAWDASVYLWRGPEGVQAVRSAHVSGGFFRSLGVAAMLGRVFTDTDDTPAAPRTVVLTYGTWQSRFGGRRDIVGQSLILDNAPYSVIGVLPREFHFAMRAAEFFTTIHDPSRCEQSRGCHDLYGLGRLRDGVSLEAATAETKAIAARLEKEYPESNKGRSARLVPFRDAIVGDIRPTLLVLSSGAGLLLLIAYVNVASLLLVRAESRKRETVLRAVLGASVGRLIRQFVTEGVLLVTVAVALAMPAASAAIPRLFRLIPERRLRGMPYFRDAGLHPRVLLFAAAISLLAVVVFSVTPVLRLSLSNLREDLAEGGRGSAGTLWKRFGSNLVAAELAIAMVLLASAGLLGKSLYRMFHVDLNFNPANLATLEIDVHGAGYEKNDQLWTLSRRLVEHISAMPGVVSVAHTSDLPITCNCNSTEFRVLGHPWYGEHDKVLQRETSADYFKVLQARLIAGRFYTEADDSSKPRVAVINRALAKRFFPGEDPVGRTIGDAELSPKSLAQVIGVVDDVREGDLVEPLVPALYYPFKQDDRRLVSCGPHRARPGTDDAVAGSCDPSGGPQPRRQKRICHGRPDQRLAGGFSEPLIGVAGGRICGVGSVARSDWPVWSDCLLGEPEDARDRRANGAGSTARGGLSIDPRPGRLCSSGWNCGWAGVFDSRRPIAERFAVWCAVLGCAYADRRGYGARDLCAIGELFAGAEGGLGESC